VYTQPNDVIAAPEACPFCNSADITTTSKAMNVSTYWRCTACGQIWNVGRLRCGHPARRVRLEGTVASELQRRN